MWCSGKGKILQKSGQEGNFGVMEIFFILNVVIIPLYMFVKTHQAIQLKVINLTLKVYFNKVDFKIKHEKGSDSSKNFYKCGSKERLKLKLGAIASAILS